jgi:aryl-alcohol dehydrogenase-like predicted oxidoreductase
MEYVTLGNSGLLVSRIAFGAVTFTQGSKDLEALYKVEEKLAGTLVGRALDAGINFFDTADAYAYGESEVLLGRALASHRDDVVIATKVGARSVASKEGLTKRGLSRRHILWAVDRSLTRLGTDWIDLYVTHNDDPATPLEEILVALDAVVRAGKARYLGFSNWSAWRVAAALEFQAANGLARFTHGQMYYSLLGRDIERDVIPMMSQYKLGLTVWGPLAGGFLSGKYTRENLRDPEGRYSGFDILPFDKEAGFALVEKLRPIAAAHNASVAQVALAWLLSRPQVTSVLLGVSKESQFSDNLGALNVKLSDAELAELDVLTALSPVYPNWYQDSVNAIMKSNSGT